MKKSGPSKTKVRFCVKLDREYCVLHTVRGNKKERKKEMWSGSRRLIFYILSAQYLLTPWCRALLEKLTGLQLVKKFPAFYGVRRFITAFTSVRHLSLSWTSPIQSTHPHPTSWRSILILSTHLCLGLPSGLFPSGFPY